jgi:hypothetical protein
MTSLYSGVLRMRYIFRPFSDHDSRVVVGVDSLANSAHCGRSNYFGRDSEGISRDPDSLGFDSCYRIWCSENLQFNRLSFLVCPFLVNRRYDARLSPTKFSQFSSLNHNTTRYTMTLLFASSVVLRTISVTRLSGSLIMSWCICVENQYSYSGEKPANSKLLPW